MLAIHLSEIKCIAKHGTKAAFRLQHQLLTKRFLFANDSKGQSQNMNKIPACVMFLMHPSLSIASSYAVCTLSSHVVIKQLSV